MHKISLVVLVVFCCFIGCLAADRKVKVAATAASAIPSWAKVSKEQIAEARKLGVPVAFANAVGVKFVLVPAGEFMMGSADNETGRYKEEGPQHKVKVRKAFYISIHQVTQGQWKAAMGTTPWDGQPHSPNVANHAVNYVNWNDATAFCAKVGVKDKRAYSLLSEAEWEYACRAGTKTPYNVECDPVDLNSIRKFAWVASFSNTSFGTRKVGARKPNAWGLYDMHGNVYEWCLDWYGPYDKSSAKDPTGPDKGTEKVIRGGCFASVHKGAKKKHDKKDLDEQVNPFLRSAARYSVPPAISSYAILGFRVVLGAAR